MKPWNENDELVPLNVYKKTYKKTKIFATASIKPHNNKGNHNTSNEPTYDANEIMDNDDSIMLEEENTANTSKLTLQDVIESLPQKPDSSFLSTPATFAAAVLKWPNYPVFWEEYRLKKD